MSELLSHASSQGVFLGGSLLILLIWVAGVLMTPARDCECPRYLLRRRSGEGGLVWKTKHRVDCSGFGS